MTSPAPRPTAAAAPPATTRPPPWWDGLPAVTAEVRCRGERHRLTWKRGRLVAHDHDLAAEEALAGLGGTPCACLDVIVAVRRHLRHLAPLGLWATDGDPAGLTLTPGDAEPPPGKAQRLADERRLDTLRGLPLPFRRLLGLATFVAAARRPEPVASWQAPPFAPVLTSLLVPAVIQSLQARWPPTAAPAPTGGLDIRWTALPADCRPGVDGRVGPGGGWVRIHLSPGWVPEVWARGVDVVGGVLVLGLTAAEPDGRSVRAVGVRWEGKPDATRRPVLEPLTVPLPSAP